MLLDIMNYNEIFHMSLLTEVTLKLYTGMEDKIIFTKGLCMLVMDEGAGFFDDIQKKQKNHESDLSMLNQLFDGKGDWMTLSQNKEHIVPPDSTAISIGIQEESFCEALVDLGKTLRLDNGFGERFLLTAVKPFK